MGLRTALLLVWDNVLLGILTELFLKNLMQSNYQKKKTLVLRSYPCWCELLQQFNLQLFRSLWKSLSCWSSSRTCVKECQTTGIIGDNIISHCQNKENDTSVGGSWYDQEQIYMQWKQLNCRTDCRYFCMMQREGERQSLGMTPVKYHGKWPFLRISVFQVCLLLLVIKTTFKRCENNVFMRKRSCEIDV